MQEWLNYEYLSAPNLRPPLRLKGSGCHYNSIFIVLCFFFFPFVLCTLCCRVLWCVYFWLSLRYSLTFLIVSSVFSNVIPVPSQGHCGFPSFPVVDWFCLFVDLWVLSLWKIARCSFILYFDLTTIWHIQSSLSCVEYVYLFTKSLIDMSFQPLGTKHCFMTKSEVRFTNNLKADIQKIWSSLYRIWSLI
jgi:hypothetical protein